MFQKFMGNKDFHPATYQNLKKVWEAEENEKAKKKRQEELRVQYLKEQEVQNSKELLGRAHPLSFMYEPPPGFKKEERKGEEDTKEKRFEWQRSGRAPPREETAKGSGDVVDQPFGVEVRKVKCLRCGNLGHVNTDSICPLYGQGKQLDESTLSGRTIADLDTREDGFIFKQCVLDRVLDSTSANQQLLGSDDEEDYEQLLLEQLTEKEKRMLLKKIKKMEKKNRHKHKRKKLKQRTSSHSADSECSSGEGDKPPKIAHFQSMGSESPSTGSPHIGRGSEPLHRPPLDGGHSREGGGSTKGGSYGKDGSYSRGSYSSEGSYSRGSYSKYKGRPKERQKDSSEEDSDVSLRRGRHRSRSPVDKRNTASKRGKEKPRRGSPDLDKSHRSGKKEGRSTLHSREGGMSRGSVSSCREHDRHRKEHELRTTLHRHS